MAARTHRTFYCILFLYFLLVFGTYIFSPSDDDSSSAASYHGPTRKLLSKSNCTKRSVEEFPEDFMTRQDREQGGIIFHLFISVYLFMTLAIVCDDYFVSSLERICEVLHLSHDVAGATFMAMGGSAPELCTAVIGVFITSSDVGISTIVGSAVFNILCVTAICALFAGKIIVLTWWPVFRDCITYCITIIALIVVLIDGLVFWYEAFIMIVIYLVYVVLLYNNNKVYLFITKVLRIHKPIIKTECNPLLPQKDTLSFGIGSSDEEEIMETGDVDSIHSRIRIDEDISHLEGEIESVFEIPDSFLKRFHWVLMLPVTTLCFLTIPDCRKPGLLRKLFFITFIMSIIWISITTYLLVWMICLIGDTLAIPDTIVGLTLLAAGASIPDAIAAYLVAKEGHGDMALSTSIGSNTLDILLGLGLPWLIKTGLIYPGSSISISSSGLIYTSVTLLTSVIILVACIIINKWRLNKILGFIFLILYGAALTFSCMYELNVFGAFSLPSCPRMRL